MGSADDIESRVVSAPETNDDAGAAPTKPAAGEPEYSYSVTFDVKQAQDGWLRIANASDAYNEEEYPERAPRKLYKGEGWIRADDARVGIQSARGYAKPDAASQRLVDLGSDWLTEMGKIQGIRACHESWVLLDYLVDRIKAAVDARTDENFVIMARTDALASEGLDSALDRAESYLEAGADALFIEALRSPEQMRAACDRFAARVPLLANMVEGGKTPVQDAGALAAVGFRIVIFPGGTARAVAHTLQGYYGSLRQHGTTGPWKDSMLDFDGLNDVIGTPELLEQGRRYEG
mgnify:CR=1 FL=1